MPNKRTIGYIVAGCLAVLIVWMGSLLYLGIPLGSVFGLSTYRKGNTPYTVLMQANSSFSRAETELQIGNATSAIALYQDALGNAADKVQHDQILYKIAYAESVRGNLSGAIDDYFAIINDPQANTAVHAYSVQSLALLWQDNGDAVVRQIFTQAPFATMYHPADLALTQREMFEYAAELYPLVLSDLNVADWYATKLLRSFDGRDPKLSPILHDKYLDELKARLKKADKNIVGVQDDPNLTGSVPVMLLVRAGIERSMAAMGLSTPEAAEQFYVRALTVYQAIPGSPQDGMVRYQYARFINLLYKGKRDDDIRKMLAPLYTVPAYEGSFAFRFFAGEKNNLHGKKQVLVDLAAIDPQFKQLLIHLGWSQSDFVAK